MTPKYDQTVVLAYVRQLDDGRVDEGDANPASIDTGPPRPGVFLMSNTFETGGSERQFAALAQSLDVKRFRLHIGCIAKRGDFSDGLGEVAEFPIGGNLYGVRSLRTRLRLARYLRNLRISVAHAFDFYTNLTLIPAARMAQVPVLIGSQRQLGDLLSPAKSRAQVMMLRGCDCVVSNSRAAAERLISQGIPERRIVVIRNGLPPATFASTPPALSRGPGLLRVGMIARMNTSSKNHRMFLRVAARLLAKFSDLEFVLAGDGQLRPQFEREAVDLGIRNYVHFLGDRRDIPAVLASIDISVLPTASESLSNVIIESMAAGVPVVASRVGGNPELIEENRGILVPPSDEQSFASEIEHLLRDSSLRAELARNAKAFAEKNFTIAEMRQRYENLYTDLLAKKTRRKPRFVLHRGNGRSTLPLRVAIVAASMRYVGGQSVQADLLLSNFRNDPAIEAHLIPIDPAFPSVLRWAEKVPVLRTLIREPFYLWALWRGLKDTDIVHIFSASYWSFLLAPAPASLMARLAGKKTLIHYHSGEARDHLKRFRTARPVLARADLLVVPSGYLVDVFREFGLAAQVVPNMVDFSRFSFRIREPIRPHLVCTRGFHPYYGVDVVVRAFAEVKQAYPEARLDLVGRGPAEAEIRSLVQQLKLTDVNFVGVASREQIGKFYDQADVFINGSSLDNMPVSILEAFASGTPVVSTAPESMRYLVEHDRTGLLSEPGDAMAVARNVIRLLEEPGLSSRIASNAHQECSRYCWKEVRRQWLELYDSMTRPSGQAGYSTST
jgi:glycosyltransferase involved in cell wall biosynthesis